MTVRRIFNEFTLPSDLYLLNFGKKSVAIASGYMNPLHSGHIKYFEEAKNWGDALIVIVNSDYQVKLKGSQPFMDEKERLEIVQALKPVTYAVLSIDMDRTVCKSIEAIREALPDCSLTFCKGGDSRSDNVPELDTCKKLVIHTVFGIGGGKIQSSSWLLKKAVEKRGEENEK
jgi:D-beta-D-heptose 7-phosphate kinase/D-beta-D-heptose 1-phosphate adenosyltransferase